MEYKEYKEIIDVALLDYINSGGSLYYIGNARQEYIFSYDDKNLSYDDQKRLSDKAVQAIISKKKLPSGVRLEKCILHGED